MWEDKVWTQAHSHQGDPHSSLFLVACVTSLARARRRLMRSSCDVTAARFWLPRSLTPGCGSFFVIKGLNTPSNPLAGHTAALLLWCYPRCTPERPWCHPLNSVVWLYEKVGQASYFPPLSWKKLSGKNWKRQIQS